MMNSIIHSIRNILTEITGNKKYESIQITDNLLTSGISSIMIIRLFMKLEQYYKFQISIDDFVPSNINTLEKMALFVVGNMKG